MRAAVPVRAREERVERAAQAEDVGVERARRAREGERPAHLGGDDAARHPADEEAAPARKRDDDRRSDRRGTRPGRSTQRARRRASSSGQ